MPTRTRGSVSGPLLAALIEWLARQPSRRLTLTGLVLLAVIAVADRETGEHVSITVGYLLPVFLAAANGRRSSIVLAGISAVAWTVLEAESIGYHYENPIIPAWNVLARFTVLWLFGALVGHLSSRLAEETGLSRTDALTGLPNARAFREATDEEIDLMRASGGSLTAAYVDVDGFKAVNDTLGHAAGDSVLAAAGRVLGAALPPGSRVARLGGDEFAVLLPRTGLDEALTLLATLRDELLRATAAWSPRVGFSVGAVTFDSPPASAADLLEQADQVMYGAKRHGRNTVRGVNADTDIDADRSAA
ncbi:hypothetical protein Ait01nite_044990 [Actinoplanes italicus]|uniref:Diguanylate cyclase (GGDEF)-like protein n=1 Tax=Actinoplanes italicus TaxID=113567 RepID=A0A2T0KCK4_9ACTN|nr:GGDEF domain-containing protein [Actinoplanes italicus]PRX20979.1 diguanylate cyclase (GGDEF)-like protein [Actinoplanes italicus]GIE31454.1 hypothetical protein Ait01nite_044990 [Actinoplanes italicus]